MDDRAIADPTALPYPVLDGLYYVAAAAYSRQFLDQVIAMVAAATMICYTLYTVDAHTVELFGSRAMLLTAPSVIYGICRYLYLIYHKHKGGDPVNLAYQGKAPDIGAFESGQK